MLNYFNKCIIYLLIVLCITVVLSIWVQAFKPEAREELVYGLNLWNGNTYTNTFCPQEKDEINVIANNNNVFAIREIPVYFWPITNEYKLNWSENSKTYNGTLEILRDNEIVESIKMIKYTFRIPDKNDFTKRELLTGNEAEEAYREYTKKLDQYYINLDEYELEFKKYYEKIKELISRTNVKEEDVPKEPKQPVLTNVYVYEPEEAFIINVKEGQYYMRLKNEKNQIVKGTEKKLIAFTSNREGIGYKILPENKWNKPKISNELQDTLYIKKGETTLFLQTFISAEYAEEEYNNLHELNKTNNKINKQYVWVHLKPYHPEKLQLLINDKIISEIKEKPYYVKQTPGYSSGYQIEEWNEDLIDTIPTFWGFRVDLNAEKYTIRMVNNKGEVVFGSERKIRTIKSKYIDFLYILLLIPLICIVFILLKNKKK